VSERSRSRLVRIAVVAALASVSAGCAVNPVPISDTENKARALADFAKLYNDQDQLTGPLTMADAVARAVKYNMDYRAKLMEQAVALGQIDVARFDLLPKLTTTAGYTSRDNDSFGFGFGTDGKVSANPSASQERTHDTYGISFAWNLLDFGMSYVRAKEVADQSLIAEERRRKALQNLIQDVRYAWWRAESAQRLLPEIDALLTEVDQFAVRAHLIETRRLLPPLQIVAYRRSLLDLEQQLSAKRQELSLAQVELASLLNLRPGTQYRLAAFDEEAFAVPDLVTQPVALEAIALENRPELREEGYKARITDTEWKKQLVSLVPNFGLDLGTNYDSNKYLLNSQWASVGLNLSFGLVKAFSLPAAKRANEAQKESDEVRRLALSAAVMAQTRMAAVRYRLLTHEFGVWEAAARDDVRIVDYLKSARQVGLETELELVRAKARALLSRIQRDSVYANVQSAIARLYNSLGLDVLPKQLASYDLPALAKGLQERIEAWEKRNFAYATPQSLEPVTVAAADGVPKEFGERFREAMQRVLRLSRVPVTIEAGGKFQLQTTVKLQPAESGGRPSTISMRIEDSAGKVLAQAEQKSMLVEPLTLEQWEALGESAAYKVAEPLRILLRKTAAAAESDRVAAQDARDPQPLAAVAARSSPP
jgi:outer membrane protein TolC